MNRYEKSLERIKKNLCPSTDWTEEDHEHLKTIFDALEKQIPKKPEESYDGYADGYPVIDYACPCCGREVDELEHHCECGQALDWSDL